MRAVYRAYCRSATRMQCSPVFMIAAIVMIVTAYGVSEFVFRYLLQVIAVARDIAAVVLCGFAAGLLVRITRAVAAARGSHYSYPLRTIPVPAPGRVIIGEHADGSPATADATPAPVPVSRPGEPAFAYTLREPLERVPGKSGLVTPLAADLTAAMAADADAFADEDTGVVVSEHGDIYELARPAEADVP